MSIDKLINNEIKEARTNKWNKVVQEIENDKNPKESWQHIKNIQGKTKKIPKRIIDQQNNIYVEKSEIANKFKESFMRLRTSGMKQINLKSKSSLKLLLKKSNLKLTI